MLTKYTIEKGQQLTEEQNREIDVAMKKPIVFDDDCKELSPAMMKAFKSAVIYRNRRKMITNHEQNWGNE